jgi:hypothetical protein
MLVSIEGFAPSAQASPFDDVQEGDWYAPFIQAAYAKNLLEIPRKGFASNPYGVGDPMTRGNVAESMYRVAVMKEGGMDTYMASDDLPERAQLTTDNLFPINLLNNQKWQIKIWRSDSQYFVVERDEANFAVQEYVIDAVTGNVKKPYLGDEYLGSFEQFSTIDEMAFMIHECHYLYKYIREGLVCDELLLPVLITQEAMHGYSAQFGDKTGQDYKVTIMRKAQKDVECNVKGQQYDGILIYFMPDSEVMRKDDWMGGFKCFETEQDAIKAGYKKSYK